MKRFLQLAVDIFILVVVLTIMTLLILRELRVVPALEKPTSIHSVGVAYELPESHAGVLFYFRLQYLAIHYISATL